MIATKGTPYALGKVRRHFFIVRAYSALNLVNSIVALFIAELPYRVAIGRVAIGGKQQTAYPAVAV